MSAWLYRCNACGEINDVGNMERREEWNPDAKRTIGYLVCPCGNDEAEEIPPCDHSRYVTKEHPDGGLAPWCMTCKGFVYL